MLLNRILELDGSESVFLAEESWQDLLDLPVTSQILEEGLDADGCIEVEGLGYALGLKEPAGAWLLLTDRYSPQKILPPRGEDWQFEVVKRVQAEEKEFLEAINECLSLSLAGELLCQSCSFQAEPHYVEERIERLMNLLPPLLPPGGEMLEICCGSGMATQALLRLGWNPMVMDSDRCEVCQGLKSGGLVPQKSMVLDARLLPSVFPPASFRAVVGFMVGLIDEFNWPLWKGIILQASRLAEERVVFSVYTEKEGEAVAKALEEAGWRTEVIDNRDSKGIYDQWVCLGRKGGN